MNRHRNVRRISFKTIGSLVSLFLVLVFAFAGCGGGGGGGGGGAAVPVPPFNPPAGITAKIVNILGCPEISVFFSVNDNQTGLPVMGLTDQNFQVRENDILKVIKDWREVIDANEPIVFSMVMDYSLSLTDQDVLNSEDAASFFVNELFDLTVPDNWGEIIKFSRDPEIMQIYTSDRTAILDGIAEPFQDRINGVTNTRLYDAIGVAIDNMVAFRGAPPAVLPERSILIAITDGKNDSSQTFTKDDNIAAAVAANIQIVAIGFGDVDQQPLFDLATGTNGLYFYAPTSNDLLGILTQLLDNLKNQYSITYDSAGAGQHQVEVDVNSGGLTGSDTLGYVCP